MLKKMMIASALLGLQSVTFAADKPPKLGVVFSGEGGAQATVVCSDRTDRCFLKMEKVNDKFDGKTPWLYVDKHGSEYRLESKEDGQIATLFTDAGRAYNLAILKTKSGKRLELKRDDAKTESLDAEAFYKTALAEKK